MALQRLLMGIVEPLSADRHRQETGGLGAGIVLGGICNPPLKQLQGFPNLDVRALPSFSQTRVLTITASGRFLKARDNSKSPGS